MQIILSGSIKGGGNVTRFKRCALCLFCVGALLLGGCMTQEPVSTAMPAETTTQPEATASPKPEPTEQPAEATPAPAQTWEEDIWVQGGWIQQQALASQGGTIYAYLGNEGALYAFDRETGTKKLALKQGSAGRQPQYYLNQCDGLLYAAGTNGSGGFCWADPQTGESGGAGFYSALCIGAVGTDGETLYLAAQNIEEETPGYGIYTGALQQGGDGLGDRIDLEAGEPLLYREGAGEISTVIVEDGALLLHEWVQEESGRTQRLVRLDLADGTETVLAESIYNAWTPRVDGKYLAVLQESDDPRVLRSVILDETGAQKAEIALPETAQTAEPAAAGTLFALDWTNQAGQRTLSLIDPATGEILRDVTLSTGWSDCLGTDGDCLYFWDSTKPDENSQLVAVDIETMEEKTPFA